ncbi:MAG: LptE family protein [Marinifilaceae bacterium]|jgi:hypothetical protein
MKLLKLLPVLLLVVGMAACKVNYSFTGGTIHEDAKTFSVQYFANRAPLVNPNLSSQFTEALKEKFRGQTNLDEIVDGEGHLNFEGEITGYSTSARDIQRDELAATNRLTVTVRVRFTNAIEEEYDFDSSFSAYYDYDSSKQLNEVEEEALEEILKQIIDDIYNKAVVNW